MLTEEQPLLEYVIQDYRITCIVTGGEWRQNTYIVSHCPSSNTLVVDPGGNAEFISEHIRSKGGKVKRILLTHPHHDHVGAASQLSQRFDVECELHKHDVRLLMHAPMYAMSFENKKIPAVTRFQFFEELSVTTEEPMLKAIHTPGHTKGSTCYLFGCFLLTGDTLLYQSVGRTDLPGSSQEAIKKSIEKLLSELPDEVTIFPGHGQPWTVGEAKEWWREIQGKPPELKSFSNGLS